MKAVISNRIYLNCEPHSELESQLLKQFRHEICQQPVSPYPKVVNLVTRISPTVVSIPKGGVFAIPQDYEIIDKTVLPKAVVPALKANLRPNQSMAVDYIQGSGLINAKPGWGKTFAGLAVAHKLQTKTLIITTTTVIRDMWVKEIKKFLGISPGIIGSGKFDIGPSVVVGNIQTVRNKVKQLSKEFGLVIIDEVHRASAPTFTSTLNDMFNRYTLGLSGTLERKDGMHAVLPAFFGDKVFVGIDENRVEPEVHLWQSMIELNSNEFIPWANKITQLLSNPAYVNELSFIIDTYLTVGHKILVVADRTQLLEHLHMQFKDRSFLITGKIKGTEIREQIMSQVSKFPEGVALFSTQSIFAEGVSLNELSAILLATPVNNEPLLEQLIGRIQRFAPTKVLTPAVIDINLSGSTGKRQANNRKHFYIGKGWRIKAIN